LSKTKQLKKFNFFHYRIFKHKNNSILPERLFDARINNDCGYEGDHFLILLIARNFKVQSVLASGKDLRGMAGIERLILDDDLLKLKKLNE
jgi:hypothetical protein